MSLLIKALEQAAKDREAQADTVKAAPAKSSFEPSVDPPPPPRRAATFDDAVTPAEAAPAPAPAPAPPPPRPRASTARSSPAPAPRPAPEPPAAGARPDNRTQAANARLAQFDVEEERARAAAVMQAAGQSGQLVISYLRANPIMAIGALAVLLGVVFGLYVYLQIAHPGMFVRQAATRPQETAPAQVPDAGTAATPLPPQASGAAAPTSPPLNPAVPVPTAPPTPGATAAAPSAPIAGSVGPAAPVAPAATAVPAASGPIPSSTVVATGRDSDAAARDSGQRFEAKREPAPPRMRADAKARSRAIASEADAAGQPGIRVSPSGAQPRLNPLATQAYAQLQAGDLQNARAAYSRLTQAEPLNIDALLGLAYIAAQENRTEDATKLYLRILQLNPRHAAAQAALIGLVGRADPGASEARLKQLIAREPSPFLHFVLGNLYADQSMWSQAQQSYFQAHHLEPDNPDYAYNLAIGLDHLRQTKLALNYYRRAEQLAASHGRANFNLSHARERISALSSQLE